MIKNTQQRPARKNHRSRGRKDSQEPVYLLKKDAEKAQAAEEPESEYTLKNEADQQPETPLPPV